MFNGKLKSKTHKMSTPTSLTKQIANTDGPIFYISRILGLAPCSIQKKDGGKIIFYFSILFCMYSFTIATIAVVWGTYGGIVNDISAGNNSIRMKGHTERIVTCVDLGAILFLAALGIFGAPFRLPNIQKFYNYLTQFDSVLIQTQLKQFRNISYSYLGTTFLLLTIVLGMDLYSWRRFAEMQTKSEFFVQNYLPFYFSYYVITILELEYVQGAKHIEYRFRKLNENLALSEMEKLEISIYKNHKQTWKVPLKLTSSSKEQRHSHNSLDYQTTTNNINDDLFKFKENNLITSSSEVVLKLCRIHGILCEAVLQLNEGFGFVVLMVLVSGLLHSIETAYFLLRELTGRKDHVFTILQFLWVGIHSLRILILIHPANAAMREAKKTKVQVCNLLCHPNLDKKLRKELEIFSLQLIHRKVKLTACEVCTLDRRLISAITGAVTTYLVILFQFNT